jgi:type III secretory pathway lipoprotein EscJ
VQDGILFEKNSTIRSLTAEDTRMLYGQEQEITQQTTAFISTKSIRQ